MKKRKFRVLSCIIAFFVIFSFVDCLNVLNVKAAEDSNNTGKVGNLEYKISNGEASITKCDSDIDGTIEIPSKIKGYNVTKIEDKAFYDCEFIDEVNIPGTVKEIGNEAFNRCLMLKKIKLGYGIETIGDSAFQKTKIQDVDMPDSVKSIGKYVFKECEDLANVKLSNSLTTIPEEAFRETGYSYSYHADYNDEDYGKSEYPNSFKYIEIPDSVTSIGKMAFINSGIEDIKWSKNLKTIGANAFGRSNFSRVVLPSSVEKIDDYAFGDSLFLQTILIPKSVTDIGSELVYKIGYSPYDTAIQGYSGSYAQKYAAREHIRFVNLDPICAFSLNSDKNTAMVGETIKLYPYVLAENDLKYKYVIKTNKQEVINTGYGSSSNFAWTPDKPGMYFVYCYMQDSEGNEKNVSKSFNIKEKSLRITDFKAEPKDSQFVNSNIPLSVKAINNDGDIEYKYTAKLKDSSDEKVLYEGKNNSFNWVPTEAGTYEITVTVKDSQNSVSNTMEYNVVNHMQLNSFKVTNENVRINNTVGFLVDLTGGKGKVTYKIYSDSGKLLMSTYDVKFGVTNIYGLGIHKYYLKAIDEAGESVQGEVSVNIYDFVKIVSVEDKDKGKVNVGDTRTFTINTTGGFGDISYKVYTDDSSIVKQISKNEINVTFGEAGHKDITIWANDSQGNTSFYSYKLYVSDDEENQKDFKIQKLDIGESTPSRLGSYVCFYADSLYGKGVVNYKYIVEKDGKENVIYDGTDDRAYFKPTETGKYKIKLVATDSENNIVSKEANFEVVPEDAVVIDQFQVGPHTPQVKGTRLDISSYASGKDNNLNYKIEVVNSNGQVVYSEDSDAFTYWTPDKAGDYKVNLTVSDSYGNVAKKSVDFEVINSMEELGKNGLAISNITTSKQSPQAKDSKIKVNAQVSGAKGEVRYSFYEYNVATDKCTYMYEGMNNYVTWNESKAGDYKIKVTALDDKREVTKEIPFTITDGEEEFNISSLTTSKPSPQAAGKRITILGEASGKGDPYTYNIKVLNSNGKVETSSDERILNWTPSKADNYKIVLKVKNSEGKELTKEMPYIIKEENAFNISSLDTDVKSPQELGKTITINGQAEGKGSPYSYSVKVFDPNGNLETSSNSKTLDWTPKEIGNYKIVFSATNSLGTKLTKEMSYFIKEVNQNTVTVYYNNYPAAYMHYRIGNGTWTQAPGVRMQDTSEMPGFTHKIVVDLGDADTLTACFNNGGNTWDNNNSRNYTFNKGSYKVSNGIVTKIENPSLSINKFNASKVSPQIVNTSINLSGEVSNAKGLVTYTFTATKNNVSKVLYSGSNSSVNWTPSESGTYTLTLQAKDSEKTVSKIMTYTIKDEEAFNITSLNTDIKSPQEVGKTITITGIASGKGAPYSYNVQVLNSKGEVEKTASSNTLSWTPKTAGDYEIVFKATNSLGTTLTKKMSYRINEVSQNTVTVYYNNYPSAYMHYRIGSGTWTQAPGVRMQDTSEIPGFTHKIVVDLGDADILTACFNNGGNTWDNNNSRNYTFNKGSYKVSNGIVTKIENPSLSINKFNASKVSPQIVNTSINLSGETSNAKGEVTYTFTATKNNVSKVLYSGSNSSVNWTPSESGTYSLTLQAKDSEKTVSKTMTYVIKDEESLSLNKFSASKVSPQIVNTSINLSGETSNAKGEVTYTFTAEKNNVSKVLYSGNNSSVNWIPSESGTYTLTLTAKDSKKTVSKTMNYVIKNEEEFNISSLSTDIDSPQEAGKTITIKGAASGKGAPYSYSIQVLNSKNEVVTSSSSNTLSWTPKTAGDYEIVFKATNNLGTTLTKEMSYKINEVSQNTVTVYYNNFSTAYMHYRIGNGTWTQVPGVRMQDTSEMPGFTHKIVVDLGDADILTACFNNGGNTWDNNSNRNYTFNKGVYKVNNGVVTKVENLSLTLNKFNTSKASPQVVNTSINLSGEASNAKGQVTYTFTATKNNVNKVLYSGSNSSVNWTPSESGTYTLTLSAKDSEKTVSKTMTYVIKDEEEFNISSLSTDINSPQELGRTIKINGSASGKGAPYSYSIQVLNSNGVVETSSSSNTLSWTPKEAGVYKIVLKAVNSLGIVLTKEMSYTIKEVSKNTTTIYYKGYDNPYIHYKVGNGQWTQVPGVKMKKSETKSGYYEITIDLGNSDNITACFNNGYGSWDSNNGRNYTFKAGKYYYSNGTITSAN